MINIINTMEKYSIKYGEENYLQSAFNILMKEGILIINDVFSNEEMDNTMDNIVTNFEKLGTGLDHKNLEKTWITKALPPQTRAGMYQSIIANLPIVWQYRTHPKIKELFQGLYSQIRNKEVTDFVTSIDGINIKPPSPPYHNNKPTDDWPHLDQTIRDEMTKCIQGQIVMTNTTAGFRCSPRSHLVHNEILDCNEVYQDDINNWSPISKSKVIRNEIMDLIEEKEGHWQIPIITSKGSMIFWFSSLIHSAKYQDKNLIINPLDIWSEWRGIIYISYRPKEDVDLQHLQRLHQAFYENRVTNHWGDRLFPKKTTFGNFHSRIIELINKPELFYKISKPIMNKDIQKLIS